MSPKTFFIDKLGVDPEKCLHGRYKDYPERSCQDVCPNKAITLNPLEIDHGLCDDCGICASVCPAGALSIKEFPLKQLLGRTISDDGAELKIRCSRAVGSCASVTCIGALDYAFFVELCTRGAKNLRLLAGNCEGCQTAPGGGIARATVNTANNILCLYEREERVILTESVDRQALESDSRRAMFRGIGRTISKFVPELEGIEQDRDPGPVPVRQQRALEILRGLEEGRRDMDPCVPLPFTAKEVDAAKCDSCNGLLKCVSFCPTEALEYSADSRFASITFKAARCIGCGLCESACHKAAVRSCTLKSGQVEELWCTKTLMGFEARECGVCGRTVIGIHDDLCHDCQQRKRKLEWEIA